MNPSDYLTYRGKCKEMSEALCAENSELTLVCGFYYEPAWNREEEHWWCKDKEGNIIDPTARQYPSGGHPAFYREHDGTFECSNCGKTCPEEEMEHESRYHFCSYECHGRFVGVL